MSVSSINYSSSLLGLSVQNINSQLSNLSTQLSSGVKSSNYAGMGVDEGFAIAARAQLSNIAAFTTTMTNVNTVISAANTGLQSMSSITSQVQSSANSSPQNLTSTGQTIGQQNAQSELSAMVGILNTQVGNRYIYSGTAISTPAVASADDIMNGTASQAGLKQVIAERLQADQGANGMGRLVLTPPTPAPAPPTPPPPSATITTVGEDVAGSPFGLKLNAVTSNLTNATVTGPSGSPAAFSVDFAGGNPNPGEAISVTFNEPDGTTEFLHIDREQREPGADGEFCHRYDDGPDRDQFQQRAEHGDLDACQQLAGRGLRRGGRRQFLQHRQFGDRQRGGQQPGRRPRRQSPVRRRCPARQEATRCRPALRPAILLPSTARR